jgi:hypothetical protein
MTDGLTPKAPGRVRGRPFEQGRSGNPLGRRVGCWNKTTIAAASLLAGEAEALTRRAVELPPVGDPWARCGSASNASCRHAADIAAAMKAVISALAGGVITPGEAATIAAELAVPDLDLIKQEEQGCGTGASGSPRDGRAIPPAGRATGGRHLCPGDRDQRFRTAFAAGRGRLRQPSGRPSRHEWRRPELALQPLGEILLQIRCR